MSSREKTYISRASTICAIEIPNICFVQTMNPERKTHNPPVMNAMVKNERHHSQT